jgi:carbamoyl-phosphate synthase large subunit
MPFVSKITDINLMELSALAILDKSITPGEAVPIQFGVKSPMFSFMRLAKAEPLTGVEMVSTGEVACFGDTFREAFLNSLAASGVNLPSPGDSILITVGGSKDKAVNIALKAHAKGFKILATTNTANALKKKGIPCKKVHKISEKGTPNILNLLENRKINFVINTPSLNRINIQIISDGYLIRRKTVEFGIPLITNLELASILIDML